MLIQRAFCQRDLRVNAKNKAEHITTKPKAERVPPADRKFLSIHMIRDDNGAIPAMVNTFMPITRAMKSGDVFSCNNVRCVVIKMPPQSPHIGRNIRVSRAKSE